MIIKNNLVFIIPFIVFYFCHRGRGRKNDSYKQSSISCRKDPPPKRDGIQYFIGVRVWCFFLRHCEVAGLNVHPNRWNGRRRVDHVHDSAYSCIPRVYEHVDEHADSRAVRAWAGRLALLFVVWPQIDFGWYVCLVLQRGRDRGDHKRNTCQTIVCVLGTYLKETHRLHFIVRFHSMGNPIENCVVFMPLW